MDKRYIEDEIHEAFLTIERIEKGKYLYEEDKHIEFYRGRKTTLEELLEQL